MPRPCLWLLSALMPVGALVLDGPAAPPGAERLIAAARAFLATLDEAGRAKATFPFDGDERTRWHFVPGVYPGVPLADLDLAQRRAAHALLLEALGTQGTLKTLAIVRLETVLRAQAEAQGQRADHRDPERYALAIFGEPADTGAWGLRFQGHHVSWNLTIVDGARVAATPKFLGANPHEVRTGPSAGERVLAAEEDGARRLIGALTDDQRDRAILSGSVPPDILLAPGREAELLGPPKGLAWTAMTAPQQQLLLELVTGYARDLAPDIAEQELARIRTAGLEGLHFAWIGSTERGQPHYYRIHGPDLVIEYDNIQDGANHSHTVWHDLRNGFGADLLRAHHEEAHRRR